MTTVDLPDTKELLLKWRQQVLDRDNNTCVNCERTRHVAPSFIVPPEVGGRLRVQNGVTVCRDCRLQAEGSRVLPTKIDDKTAINFLISRELHDKVDVAAKTSNFGGISALVRHMMLAYVSAPEQFEDLHLWQDLSTGNNTVKINGWVDGAQYEVFKQVCHRQNITFTNAFKGLLMVYLDSDKPAAPEQGVQS